jgi:predicted lipoprotein with Yx(FWY)xxD motif
VLAATVIAGCGSSNSSSSTPKAAAASGAPAASTSAPAGGGAYGAPATTTATSSSAAAAHRQPAGLITTKHGKLGTILAFGPKRLTVYLFEADSHGRSACAGACAAAWPPVIGTPKAAGGAVSADLGTITRPGGAHQITYKGHPLYLFVRDKDDGDAYGQDVHAFGADWYALQPSGAQAGDDS